MDFPRQCKRFLNYRVFRNFLSQQTLSDISAIGVIRVGESYRIVVADNEAQCLCIINEADGQLVKEVSIDYVTYGLCCTSLPPSRSARNHIYVSDYTNNLIRKYDDNLNEVSRVRIDENNTDDEAAAAVTPLDGPCGIAVNNELKQLQCIDQNNNRIVFFSLASAPNAHDETYVGEFKLFQEDLTRSVKHVRVVPHDLSVAVNHDDHVEVVKKRVALDFRPFGLCTRNERFYVTDWLRGFVYIYKNNVLEKKCSSSSSRGARFRRPRDLALDSLGNILVADSDRQCFYVMDNKGTCLYETKVPKSKGTGAAKHEKGIFGVVSMPGANKLIFASNCSIYSVDLIA